jgi:hypothetical protein
VGRSVLVALDRVGKDFSSYVALGKAVKVVD